MNRSLCCLLFAAVFLTTGCRDELDHELDRTIRELNDVIRNEAVYVERRHRIIRKYRDIADTTRSKRTRAWAYTTLAGHYSHFQLDSSAYYCRMARALAEELGDERLINDAKVRTAIVLIGNVELAEANRILRSVDTTDSRKVDLTLYYRTRATVFRESKRFSVFPEVQSRYDDSLKYYLRAYLNRASGPRIAYRLSEKEFRSRTAASRRTQPRGAGKARRADPGRHRQPRYFPEGQHHLPDRAQLHRHGRQPAGHAVGGPGFDLRAFGLDARPHVALPAGADTL